MSNVWRGTYVSGIAGTGNGAEVTVPHTEQNTADFCTSSGGVLTFSQAGTFHIAASAHCITGSGTPDYLDIRVRTSAGGVIFARHTAYRGGWDVNGFVAGILEIEVGDTLWNTVVIAGYGSDALGANNRNDTDGRHLIVTRLPE